MNKKEQELFISFFEELYEAEESFEQIKAKLLSKDPECLSQLFNTVSLGEDEITIGRLREYLNDKITCNERELYELFEKIDLSRYGFISRQDFIRELTPLDQMMKIGNQEGEVPPEIESLFLELILEYIKRFRIIEVSRQEIAFIAPYKAFEELDNFRTGVIGLGELQRFFQNNDFSITDHELILLLHALRRRCYVEVNLEVFCENLNPLEFGEYDAYRANFEQEKQKEILTRSRRDDEYVRRSRIENRNAEHNIAKEERRRKAELLSLVQKQEKAVLEMELAEKERDRVLRSAFQQEEEILTDLEAKKIALDRERQKIFSDRIVNEELSLINHQSAQINDTLVRSALVREDELDYSRRVRYELERSREAEINLSLERESRRREEEILREKTLREQSFKEIERERQLQLQRIRERDIAIEQEFQREREERRRRWQEEMENSYKYNKESDVKLQSYTSDVKNGSSSYDNIIGTSSRRIADLERELEKTRMEMRERQSRINMTQSKRQPETAERSYFNRT